MQNHPLISYYIGSHLVLTLTCAQLRMLGKIACIAFFMLRKHPHSAVPLLAYPVLIFVYLQCTCHGLQLMIFLLVGRFDFREHVCFPPKIDEPCL